MHGFSSGDIVLKVVRCTMLSLAANLTCRQFSNGYDMEACQLSANSNCRADIDAAYVDDSFRDGRKGTHSPPAGDSVVKYSLRKTSMQGLLFISNKLYGIYGESCNSTGEACHNDGEAAIILGAQGDLRLDLAEAGQWRPRDTENGNTANENMGRLTEAAGMGRRVPLKYHDGTTIHDGATNLVVHLNAKVG